MKAPIIAALAVGFAGFAGAAEVQKDKTPVPTIKAKKMSNSEMDKVTAGTAGALGTGLDTAITVTTKVLNANSGYQTAVSRTGNPNIGTGTRTQ